VAQSIQPTSATQSRIEPTAEQPPRRSAVEPPPETPATPPVERRSQVQPPTPEVRTESKLEIPKPPPIKAPPRESIDGAPPPPPPPKRSTERERPKPAASDRPKQRQRDEDDDEVIDLEPVPKKKSRLPLIIAAIGVGFLMCSGLAGGIWYFVIRDQGLPHKIAAPNKAWAFRLPDAPQTMEIKGGNNEYSYSRPGKDAEFTVNVNESQEPMPDEMMDLGAGLMFMTVASKYKLDAVVTTPPRPDTTSYEGQYPRRLFEVDSGSRGKLTVQLIFVKWAGNKSTTIIQVAIGKDISDSERQAFFKSVEIKKQAR
jgi:hypothetical protein